MGSVCIHFGHAFAALSALDALPVLRYNGRMKPCSTLCKLLALVAAGFMLLIGPHNATAARSWMTITPFENEEQMVQMRLAGVQYDKSQINVLIKELQSPPGCKNPYYDPNPLPGIPNGQHHYHDQFIHDIDIDNEYRLTLMHALAQMGTASAVPEMDNIIETNKDPDVVNYAKVCKARLLAESSTPTKPGAATPAQLNRKVERFLTEMGMTAADLNVGAGDAEAAHREFLAHPYSDGGSVTPLGLIAMREVADILYRDGAVSPASVSALKGIEFNRDAPSWLKMKLTPLTRQQRVDALIAYLITKSKDFSEQIQGKFIEQYQEQLLCDEGLLAKKALAAVLMPRAGSTNGRPVADKSGDLTNTYNNIAGDGSVPLALPGGWQDNMKATHILRRQYVTEY